MVIYKPVLGENIGDTAKRLVDMVKQTGGAVTTEFNDIRITVWPGDTPESIVQYYTAELYGHHKERVKQETSDAVARWNRESFEAFAAGIAREQADGIDIVESRETERYFREYSGWQGEVRTNGWKLFVDGWTFRCVAGFHGRAWELLCECEKCGEKRWSWRNHLVLLFKYLEGEIGRGYVSEEIDPPEESGHKHIWRAARGVQEKKS